MRQASKLGVGIVAVLAGWFLVTSVDGQQPLGSQPPPVKKGHLIIAGTKEYDLLSEVPEVEGKFRSFDPDTSIVKVQVEYVHADEKHRDEFNRQQKSYTDQMKHIQERAKTLQKEYRQQSSGRLSSQDKNNRMNNFNSQMQSLNNEKNTADQQYRDALKNLDMVRDYIDYELLVAQDAPIRKMWAPKLFDDKGKVRSMTADERVKYKGHDPKMVGWNTKLEIFEKDTPVKVKILSAALKGSEPTNSQTPPTTSPDFKTFDSPAGQFSVLMPGAPKENTQGVPTPAGQIQVTTFTAELSGTTYIASFSDMPKGLINDATRETFYDGTIKGAAAALKATILSTNKTRLGGRDGRESLAKLPAGVLIRAKICAVGDRLYQAQVLGPESSVKSDDATRFFDSFRVLGDSAGKQSAVKLEDRPVVKMVIAEADPHAPTPPPAPVKQPTYRKY